MPQKRLYRSCENRIIAGICAGIAKYFGLDAVLVRLLFVLIVLFGGAGIIAYLIAWFIIPEDPSCRKGEEKIEEKQTTNKSNHPHLIVGLILIVIGAAILFNNLFSWISWSKLWPFILILIGLGFLIRAGKKDEQ